jgi:hypothetical protein
MADIHVANLPKHAEIQVANLPSDGLLSNAIVMRA